MTKIVYFATFALLFILGVSACNRSAAEREKDDLRIAYERPASEWPAPTLDSGVVHHEIGVLRRKHLIPSVSPLKDSIVNTKALATLGKQLFFDPILSASNQVSCGSCHDPDLAWGDGRQRSFGHDRARGGRNAPSLLNAGHWKSLFWDGRATTLEEQVLGPLQDSKEMMQDLDDLEGELSAYPQYQEAFKKAFGVSTINPARVALALAAFERTIRSRTSRFDHFANGKYDALTDQEIRGLDLFRKKGRCMNCHNGPLFSDQEMHNQGTHLFGRSSEDLGAYALTGKWEDAGKFRTPMLRDVTFTGPYFHHGTVVELREVIQLYNAGMPQIIPRGIAKRAERLPVHDALLKPLQLTEQEIDDLVAFMGAISTRPRAMRVPDRFQLPDSDF